MRTSIGGNVQQIFNGRNADEARIAEADGAGSNAPYEKIIAAAKQQVKELGCFVAGTLVHTQEGLRPIEQIKVGDYVLSKSESGEGEASYKRVTRTFEKEGQEVWYVGYILPNEPIKMEFVVVTGNHPFWVVRLENDSEIKEVMAWVDADKFYELVAQTGLYPVFEIQNKQLVRWGDSGPLLRTSTPEVGVVYSYPDGEPFYEGWGVDFSRGIPELVCDEAGSAYISILDIEPEEYVYGENSILSISGGFHPMLHKVYNLEVEDNHTYYVGAAGVLVHNTCAKEVGRVNATKLRSLKPAWHKPLAGKFFSYPARIPAGIKNGEYGDHIVIDAVINREWKTFGE
jgi:hypothetical protein